MNKEEFFIRANVFGKIKYWNHIDGLHSGSKGYEIFSGKRKALNMVKRLKKIFHCNIKFEILPEKELPFLKKQIVKK